MCTLNFIKQTPKYFTEQDVCSFLPDNFDYRSVTKIKPFRVNMATPVLAILSDILLKFNHCEKNVRSLLTDLFISLTEPLKDLTK